jgi:Mg2+ and Co2+ transporter CorA
MRTLADGGAVRRVVFESTDGTFRWIDITSPDRSVLLKLQEELGLPETAAEDCLDARQLPKHERHGGIMFMILRAHVDPVPEFAANSYELTQPLVVSTGPGFLRSSTIPRLRYSTM